MTADTQAPASPSAHTVIIYSDDPGIRDRMRTAVGRRPARDVRVEYLEAATSAEVMALVEENDVDLLLLDGEAWPAGGLGIARQLRDELEDSPTTCVVLARAADRWLAAWSGADAVLVHPLDPVRTAETVADLLRGRTLAPSSR
ncbi:MAG: hypothetical protein ACRDT8_02635 [Micromonosporaceae bacterium]